MTIKGYLIKADDNSKTHLELEGGDGAVLEALQGFVGGYVEAQYDTDHTVVFWINEDGKRLGLPVNGLATAYWWLVNPMFRDQDVLVGDVVITGGADSRGKTQSISAEMEHIIVDTYLQED